MTGRILTLDLGNSTLAVGVFESDRLVKHLRLPSDASAQQLIRRVGKSFSTVALSSVVPERTAPLFTALETAVGLRPLLLSAAANHGLKIGYRRPAQLGTDRIAAALGARKLYPSQNLVIIDCGTATTLSFLTRESELLGGAILPGLALWPAALAHATAKLPSVKLPRAQGSLPPLVAKDTVSAIRAGALYGHAGAIRELAARGAHDAFGAHAAALALDAPRRGPAQTRQSVTVIGTGGQAPHFAAQSCFTVTEPALTLHGLQAYAAAQHA
ncbi:hypothetical protein AXK12_02810 [Cephaloticoccus capnophilus]|uniref:Type III pantothenate kinase n=1 Tax=Cephaloticoccus capnophilus TaxID=1548208 RepID=A0A139SQ18_9BACT|nr:type III pantothenate kinase [Cephaloticoccus capnophilus]KXU36705.1 hypothetical protein AXK12_02810 [Cephaloticoccus capnophilus]